MDSDGDGIPDEWEVRHRLDPSNPRDGQAVAKSGYTVVEEYLNSLLPVPGAAAGEESGGGASERTGPSKIVVP